MPQTWILIGSGQMFVVPAGDKEALFNVVAAAFKEPLELGKPSGGKMAEQRKKALAIMGTPSSNPNSN